ncbi:MAG: hypothetical protein NW208_06190 [Bryobacter sp.]|nr:hypothetical protein [Bryobacter sp.]
MLARAFFLSLVLLAGHTTAQASMITFTAILSNVQGTLASQYTIGDTLTGYVEFTTSSIDLEPFPDQGQFTSTGPGFAIRFSNGTNFRANGTTESFTTIVGNFSFEDQLFVSSPIINNRRVVIAIYGTPDLFTSPAYPSFAGAILPSAFKLGSVFLDEYPNGMLSSDNTATFDIDSFDVPEPATYAYSGFGLVALAAWRLTKLASKRAAPGTAKGVCR